MSEILKRCGCGKSYSAAEWAALPFGYYQDVGAGEPTDENPEPHQLENRHCSCGSTIAIIVNPRPAE